MSAPRLLVHARVDGLPGAPPRLDVNFTADEGLTAIRGASGAGKTTLLSVIAGLVRPTSGLVVLDSDSLADETRFVPSHRRRIAMVFQSFALFPHLTVWENVAYGLPKQYRANYRDRAQSWLFKAHASHLADRSPATLSGGEAQRVALARALASEPRLLLLDEPFSALDNALRRELEAELRDIVTTLPTLLATHDHDNIAQIATKTVFLEGGKLLEPVR